MTLAPGVAAALLALADDELFMGHRHSEWLGVAPFLEEDLAHASIAQDELGHARALYGLLSADIDTLAFEREPHEYRCCRLVELPCTDWEDTLARHFLYDMAERVRWQSLAGCSVAAAAELAAKALREEAYHLEHAVPLVERLLRGTEESRMRMAGALQRLYPVSRSLFEPTEAEADAVAAGLADARDMERQWIADVRMYLEPVDVALDWDTEPTGYGGRRGRRSGHFAEMHADMTAVYSIDPAATW